jgi:cytochrome P450
MVKEVEHIINTPKNIRDAQERKTIFTEILNSKLPPEEKEAERIGQDAGLIVAAGMITTAWSLCIATYFFLADSSGDMLGRVKSELESAMPDPSILPPVPVLEKLPYFTACITECIRLNYGTSGRLQRCAPTETLIYTDGDKKYQLPPGTPVSMTTLLLHHDESIYPDSTSFVPERWLENPRLDRYMLSFARGTRQCLGINFAYAELYLFLAAIFRNYGSPSCRRPGDKGILELYETDKSDVDCVADMTIPAVKVGSKGVRIRVLS